ncbi:MAG: putative colanic acid biosynthesis acetyltransferase [Pseudomonadota bacterium]
MTEQKTVIELQKPENLEVFRSPSLSNKLARASWAVLYFLLYRIIPVPFFAPRRILLRLFGATIANDALPYPGAKIWAPWNLVMGPNSCLADGVNCYNVARVTLSENALVSQRSHLCTASHDFRSERFELIAAKITIHANAWVAAEAFVGPGVTIGKESVVAARAVINKSVPSGVVVAGNPATIIKLRGEIKPESKR